MKSAFKLVVLIPALICGCTGCRGGGHAPLQDGLFLSYDIAGSTVTVTFNALGKNRYEAVFDPGGVRTIVNASLKKRSGGVYDAGILGPLWVPPGQVKPGGRAHGDKFVAMRSWNRWQVGVVKASFGIGDALRGEWYYERQTGFLVGGLKATAATGEGEETKFVLIDTNLVGLKQE